MKSPRTKVKNVLQNCMSQKDISTGTTHLFNCGSQSIRSALSKLGQENALQVNLENSNNLNDASKTELVKSAQKSWLQQGWTPKAGLNKHRLFLTKTQTTILNSNKSAQTLDQNQQQVEKNKEY